VSEDFRREAAGPAAAVRPGGAPGAAHEPPEVGRVLARNLAWLGAGEVALKGALFAAGVIVARGMGPAGMGTFTVAYGAALVLVQLLSAGQIEVLIRETARFPERGRALLGESRRYQARVAAVMVPLALAGFWAVPLPDLRWTLIAFIPYAWLRCWLISSGAVFKGLDRMEVEVSARAVELGIALPLLLLLSWRGAPVWVTGLAFAVGGAAGAGWITRRLGILPASGRAPLSRSLLIREGLPFLGLAVVSMLLVRADSFLLASLGVSQADIGRYGVAAAPVWGLLGVAQLLALASYPTLARAAARGELGTLWSAGLAGTGAVLGAGLASLLVLFRHPLIGLFFGPAFLPAARILGVLAWLLPGACAGMLLGALLAASRRQTWALAVEGVLLVMAVAANLAVIPRFGVVGCAGVAVAVQTLGAGAVLVIAAATRPQVLELESSAVLARSE
jgi:O-antigen/teichoic acid export membrane protein